MNFMHQTDNLCPMIPFTYYLVPLSGGPECMEQYPLLHTSSWWCLIKQRGNFPFLITIIINYSSNVKGNIMQLKLRETVSSYGTFFERVVMIGCVLWGGIKLLLIGFDVGNSKWVFSPLGFLSRREATQVYQLSFINPKHSAEWGKSPAQ